MIQTFFRRDANKIKTVSFVNSFSAIFFKPDSAFFSILIENVVDLDLKI